jgi:hypothetical protein
MSADDDALHLRVVLQGRQLLLVKLLLLGADAERKIPIMPATAQAARTRPRTLFTGSSMSEPPH